MGNNPYGKSNPEVLTQLSISCICDTNPRRKRVCLLIFVSTQKESQGKSAFPCWVDCGPRLGSKVKWKYKYKQEDSWSLPVGSLPDMQAFRNDTWASSHNQTAQLAASVPWKQPSLDGRGCQISPKELASGLWRCLVSVWVSNHWLPWTWFLCIWVKGPPPGSQEYKGICSWPELIDSDCCF